MKLPRPRLPRPRFSRPSLTRPSLPRPSGILTGVRGALAAAWRALESAGRGIGSAAQAVADRWLLLSVYARRRILLGAGLVVAVAILHFAIAPTLPCRFPGGDECPQADHAIGLVPSDASVYAHVAIDPGNGQFESAAVLAGRLPKLTEQLVGGVAAGFPAFKDAGLSPGAKRAEWVGGEAAIARLPAGLVELISATDEAGAQRYIDSRRKGSAELVDGFVVSGTPAVVGEVADTAKGVKGTSSLAGFADFKSIRQTLPDPRFADVYLSADMMRSLVSSTGSTFSAVASLVGSDPGPASLALVASGDSVELSLLAYLGPLPGLPIPAETFTPALPADLPAGSLAYLGLGNPIGTPGRPPGILTTASELLGGPSRQPLAKVFRKLAPALGGESALALAPPQEVAGVPEGPPALQLLATGVNEPLARGALGPNGLDVPFELSKGELRAATSQSALAQLKHPAASLDSKPSFDAATTGFASAPTLEAYLDIEGLRPLFESAGLAANPAYASLAPEIRRLEALGVSIENIGSVLHAQLRLVIGELQAQGQ